VLAQFVLVVALAGQVGDRPPPPASDDGYTVRTEPRDDDTLRAAWVGSASALAGALGAGAMTALAASTLYSSSFAPTEGLAITLGLAGTAFIVGIPFAAGWVAGAAALIALGRFRASDWSNLNTCVAGSYCGLVGVALFLPLAVIGGGPVMMCRTSPLAFSAFGNGRRGEPWWTPIVSSPAFPPVLGAGLGAVLVGVGGAVAGRLSIPGDVGPGDTDAWLLIGGAAAGGAAAGSAVGGFFGGVFASEWADAYE
jgi:hypothetical protein